MHSPISRRALAIGMCALRFGVRSRSVRLGRQQQHVVE